MDRQRVVFALDEVRFHVIRGVSEGVGTAFFSVAHARIDGALMVWGELKSFLMGQRPAVYVGAAVVAAGGLGVELAVMGTRGGRPVQIGRAEATLLAVESGLPGLSRDFFVVCVSGVSEMELLEVGS